MTTALAIFFASVLILRVIYEVLIRVARVLYSILLTVQEFTDEKPREDDAVD